MQKLPSEAIEHPKLSIRKRAAAMEADQPRAFYDDDLFSFMAKSDVPQEQDLLLLNLIDI